MRRTLAAVCAALIILLGFGTAGASAYTNGHAPASALAPINAGVSCEPLGGQLDNQAAADYNTMVLAAGQVLPINGCDSAYRSYERQVYWRSYWCGRGLCGNAALPGTSNHGIGEAVDASQITVAYIRKHGGAFCWAKTEALHEWWHYNHVSGCNRPDPGTNMKSPRLQRGSGGPGQNVFVRKAQKLLRGHGFKRLKVTAFFNRQTSIAVRKLQKAHNLKPTGVINARVWKLLRRPLSKPLPTTPKHVPKSGGTAAPPANPKHPKPPKPKPKPPKTGPAWGIDISSFQGDVDFKAVRRDGASFAITKATQGVNYRNPYFGRAQLAAIGAAGLVPGVYHYLDPQRGSSGAAEAAWFVNAIGAAGYGRGFLPPVVDVEETELAPRATCHYLHAFTRVVRKSLGVVPIVYTFPSFVASRLGACPWLKNHPLWIAHLGVSSPTVPSPWSDYKIWQYSWTGRVAGVAGDVDLNKIPGGRAALVKLRVGQLPKRARLAPRANTVARPLAIENVAALRASVPAAAKVPLEEVAAPEGDATTAAEVAAPESAIAGDVDQEATTTAEAIAELIHALGVLFGR